MELTLFQAPIVVAGHAPEGGERPVSLPLVICIWVHRVRSPIGESVPVLVLPLLFLGIRRPEVYIYIMRPQPAVITHSLLHQCPTLGDHSAALSASPILVG